MKRGKSKTMKVKNSPSIRRNGSNVSSSTTPSRPSQSRRSTNNINSNTAPAPASHSQAVFNDIDVDAIFKKRTKPSSSPNNDVASGNLFNDPAESGDIGMSMSMGMSTSFGIGAVGSNVTGMSSIAYSNNGSQSYNNVKPVKNKIKDKLSLTRSNTARIGNVTTGAIPGTSDANANANATSHNNSLIEDMGISSLNLSLATGPGTGTSSAKEKKVKMTISDPTDSNAVASLISHLVPVTNTGTGTNHAHASSNNNKNNNNNHHSEESKINPYDHVNECLLAIRVQKFEFTNQNGTTSTRIHKNLLEQSDSGHGHGHGSAMGATGAGTVGLGNMTINPKNKNKLRYVCVTRSTNAPLQHPTASGSGINPHEDNMDQEEDDLSEDSEDDDENNDDYSLLYNPNDKDADAEVSPQRRHRRTKTLPTKNTKKKLRRRKNKHNVDVDTGSLAMVDTKRYHFAPPEQERSSIPNLVFLAIHTDGTHPDVREIRNLEELIAIENVVVSSNSNTGAKGSSGMRRGTGPRGRKNQTVGDDGTGTSAGAGTGIVKLVFQNGGIVEIDCGAGDGIHDESGGNKLSNNLNATDPSRSASIGGTHDKSRSSGLSGLSSGLRVHLGEEATKTPFLQKHRFLWSLLQVHAISSSAAAFAFARATGRPGTGSGGVSVGNGAGIVTVGHAAHTPSGLSQLTMRHVDRAELQYISTVNGFLSDNPVLCALLERQRNLTLQSSASGEGGPGASGNLRQGLGLKYGSSKGVRAGSTDPNDLLLGGVGQVDEETKRDGPMEEEMDGIAYDMIMGNFGRMTLFLSEEEKVDAEEVLNAMIKSDGTSDNNDLLRDDGRTSSSKLLDGEEDRDIFNLNEGDTSENLMQLLQKRMRDLEAETCRRLIAWEDEKQYSVSGTSPAKRDTTEAQSLASLFETLDSLDKELEDMEEWLSDKTTAIKPLTDDCREVEEVNRELDQQKFSYELLSIELGRLLDGLEVAPGAMDVLMDPTALMVYDRNGDINVKASEPTVEQIYDAGKALKMSFDKVQEEGGVHLRAVSEQVEDLLQLSNEFCRAIAGIVVAVMKRTIAEVGETDDLSSKQDSKHSSHGATAKSIRNTQRQFQTSLLGYIKLIEVLALLKPSILPSVRDSYAQLVADGILSKKRLKNYFFTLPGKSSVNMDMYTIDIAIYQPVALRSSPITDPNHQHMKPAQAKDVEIALAELLPVIAREAYFTAALFGLSAKHLSGREKKRNFESAKKSVDFSSQYFKYYIARICGIASEAESEGKKVFADPMLSLVASILLNEAMENYIDRQKKGGDHSLSLAYVRATILDLRKKVDKQWVSWVEEQIKWIQTNPAVPLNGKRAGVFTAFSRFPSYLDHVMICCKAGRPKDHVPNLSRIKVVTYYLQKLAASLFNSLHECSERETTDQQYAANVMRMENSYFFTQTIKQRGPQLSELFSKQITAASSICKQSTDAYLGFMIKREFKSLHTLFASISRIRREVGDNDVPIHVPRSSFEKTLSKECNREILKEKIGAIYYRMEKHLSESGGLLPVAWKALVKVLYEWFGRWEKLSSQCYKFNLEPSASDVVRIAKQAAGLSAKKISDEKKRSGAG